MGRKVSSGEPLPVPPRVDSAELAAFFRKVIDYLRRLQGLIDRLVIDSGGGGGGSNVLVFSAHLSADANLGTGTWAVPWSTVLRKDSVFTHTVGSGVIQVTQTGHYVVAATLQVNKNFALQARVSLVDAGGTEVSVPTYGHLVEPLGYFPAIGEIIDGVVPLNLTAGDRIALIMDQTDAFARENGTRIVATYYGEEA